MRATYQKLFLLTGIYLVLCAAAPAYCWDPPLDIYMTYIKFDWNPDDNTNDAIDIRENYSSDYSRPEWRPSTSTNNPFAYCMELDGPRIKAYFECTEAYFIWKMDVEATIQSGHSIMESIEGQIVFPYGGTISHVEDDLTIDDTFDHIDIDEGMYWSWDVVRWYNPYNVAYEQSYHILTNSANPVKCFTLLDVPDVPWYYSGDGDYDETFGRMEPWTENVLDSACIWASGETNATAAITNVTEKTFAWWDATYEYHPNLPASPLSHDMRDGKLAFLILYTLDGPRLNCYSSSDYVHVLTRALGINTTLMFISKIGNDFYTNPVRCFGKGSFTSLYWSFHQVVYYNGGVFDPTGKVNPPEPNSYVPVNLDTTAYKQILLYQGYDWDIQTTTKYIQAVLNY